MARESDRELVARNGHTLAAGIVARISGCANQKELSLEDQEDHGKEVVAEMYDGPAEFRVIATRGKGERLDRPELADIEAMLRTGELDLLVMEDVGRMVRGADAVRLWGIAVDHGIRCIAPNDCCDTADDNWEQDLLNACAEHVAHIRAARRGGHVGYVGVPHGVELNGEGLFFAHVHLHGGPAPVRRYLPELIDLVLNRKIDPGKVFDLTLPLDQVAEGYRAMDERRAIKALLRP